MPSVGQEGHPSSPELLLRLTAGEPSECMTPTCGLPSRSRLKARCWLSGDQAAFVWAEGPQVSLCRPVRSALMM